MCNQDRAGKGGGTSGLGILGKLSMCNRNLEYVQSEPHRACVIGTTPRHYWLWGSL